MSQKTVDREKFKAKVDTWIKENGWEDISKDIDSIYGQYRLEELPYKPDHLIKKDNIVFFVNFFFKGNWAYNQKMQSEVTGFDLYKFRFLNYLQKITNIQVGVIMYNETEDKMVFKQIDQLSKPVIYFGTMGCRAFALKPKYNDVVYDQRGQHKEFNCSLCWEKYPHITKQCITKNYEGAPKRKRREMAMWSIDEFADSMTIQPRLI